MNVIEADLWEPKIAIEADGNVPDISLPPDWIALYHKCGGIVYLHKPSRVVTWSRPYMLSKNASIRKHDIPLMVIPCLHQLVSKSHSSSLKRKLDCSNIQSNISTKKIRKDFQNVSASQNLHDVNSAVSNKPDNPTQVDTDNSDIQNVNNDDVSDVEFISTKALHCYLSRIYNFRVISDEESAIPVYSDNISNSVNQIVVSKKSQPKPFTTKGKVPKQALHEYIQKYLKTSLDYRRKEGNWQSDRADLFAEVLIGDRKFGIGSGGTWKMAMQDAAAKTLSIIDPELLDEPMIMANDISQDFNKYDICDERLSEMIEKNLTSDKSSNLLSPYKTLLKLLKRHEDPLEFLETDITISVNHSLFDNVKYQYSMKYKDVNVQGLHNQRDCKDVASQYMIKILYPSLKSWGSVMRLTKVKWKKFVSQSSASAASSLKDVPVNDTAAGSSSKGNILAKLQSAMMKQSSTIDT